LVDPLSKDVAHDVDFLWLGDGRDVVGTGERGRKLVAEGGGLFERSGP